MQSGNSFIQQRLALIKSFFFANNESIVTNKYTNSINTIKDWVRDVGKIIYFNDKKLFNHAIGHNINVNNISHKITENLPNTHKKIQQYIENYSHQSGFLNISGLSTSGVFLENNIIFQVEKKRLDFIENNDGSCTFIERVYINSYRKVDENKIFYPNKALDLVKMENEEDECECGKIYLKVLPDGLLCRALTTQYGKVNHLIPWKKLPQNFPRDIESILQYQDENIHFLLNYFNYVGFCFIPKHPIAIGMTESIIKIDKNNKLHHEFCKDKILINDQTKGKLLYRPKDKNSLKSGEKTTIDLKYIGVNIDKVEKKLNEHIASRLAFFPKVKNFINTYFTQYTLSRFSLLTDPEKSVNVPFEFTPSEMSKTTKSSKPAKKKIFRLINNFFRKKNCTLPTPITDLDFSHPTYGEEINKKNTYKK